MSEKIPPQRRWYFWPRIRRFCLTLFLLLALRDGLADDSRYGMIKAQVRGYEFNYIGWEVDALWQKFKQSLFGFQTYISDTEAKSLTIEYLQTVRQIQEHDAQIDAIYNDASILQPIMVAETLIQARAELEKRRQALQPLVEPLIERQVSTVLQEEGFGVLGQILPPVSFRFVDSPDVLVISPRHVIQQDFTLSLRPMSNQERSLLEANVAEIAPNDSVYITGTGGVGIWPAIIIQTPYLSISFEVVAHEWSHHYLFMFPNGMEYLVRPESRIINETTATIFGNTIGIKVLERFYADEVAQGLVWVPDYPTLDDFYGRTEPLLTDPDLPNTTTDARQTADWLLLNQQNAAAQWVLDTAPPLLPDDPDLAPLLPNAAHIEINHTRISADYLLALGYIDAAEDFMEAKRQILGMRVLNQAWFAFNGGYQADPSAGGGIIINPSVDVTDTDFLGDPIGPAIQEIMQLAPTTEDFLIALRDVTTREALLAALIEARGRWGAATQ